MKSCEYPECGCDKDRALSCPGNWEMDLGGAYIRKEQMKTVSMSVKEAETFLSKHERHYKAPVEPICAIGIKDESGIHGAAILGRKSETEAELAHIYVDGTFQGYSILYGACWRALKALGYEKAVL
jgi:hypothetical protein